LDWLLEQDSMGTIVPEDRPAWLNLFTINVPVGARVFDWLSDSGDMVTPVSMRYRLQVKEARRWEIRVQTNRNAGDTCFALPDKGLPENLSGGILIRPGMIFHEIIAGDFQVNSGFGVVLGSSPVFSVSLGNPGSLHRLGKGIRLYSGSSNGNFFRGLAGSIVKGKSEFILFGSGKDLINQEVEGFGWKMGFTGSEVGITGIHVNNQFAPVIKEGWSSVWQPDSGRFSRAGIWGQTRLPFGILFGETGWSLKGDFGWIAGFRWFEAHGFSAVVRYAGCSPGYPVPFSLFQSGNNLTREGQRFIMSFRYAPARLIEWLGSAEVDLSKWPGSNAHFNNYSTRISQQMKYLSKNRWIATGSLQIDFLESEDSPQKLTWKLAFDSDPKLTGTVRFRAGFRQQIQGFGKGITKGSTADCSLVLMLADKSLRITGGLRIFTAENGTDPLYAYEPDVLYGWSAPVLSGSGTRCYITTRYKVMKNIDIEIKVSQTAYHDLKHLNEGNKGGLNGKVQLTWRGT